jgi:hypothetical protein
MTRKRDKLPGLMTLWRGYKIFQETLITLSIFRGIVN